MLNNKVIFVFSKLYNEDITFDLELKGVFEKYTFDW
jgi:hypothetical protein